MVVVTLTDLCIPVFYRKNKFRGRLQIRYVMPSARLTLREEDVVRLALEFLHNRDLHISQLSLERETGVINGNFSDDILFLRQLILDGQWDDVLEFIQPLEALQTFDMKKFSYTILKHKYIELLCIKSEASTVAGNNVDNAVEEVVKVLNDLEKYAPSKEDHSNLCLLLTLPRLTDHFQYKDWNPSNARVQCFREIHPLVADFLTADRKSSDTSNSNGTSCNGNGNGCCAAKNDRLIQLIIKGILYESCVNYCQAKATATNSTTSNGANSSLENHAHNHNHSYEMNFSKLLDGSQGFSDSDLSLLSWLQSVPHETFTVPFEQRTLNVDVERLDKPSLETSWAEHMLITPIKPKTFPHSAMPFTRPKSAADVMSKSLIPVLEHHQAVHNSAGKNMAMSTGDICLGGATNNPMSRSSFASFHLTGIKNSNKLMNASVDRLFENEGEVFLSNSFAEFNQQLPSIQEQRNVSSPTPSNGKRNRSPELRVSNVSTPEHRAAMNPSPNSTLRSSRRDSLNEKPQHQPQLAQVTAQLPQMAQLPQLPVLQQQAGELQIQFAEQNYNGDLMREFQKQKQRLQDTLNAREKEREELLRQINSNGNEFAENCKPGVNGNYGRTQANGNGVYGGKLAAQRSGGEGDVQGGGGGIYDSVQNQLPKSTSNNEQHHHQTNQPHQNTNNLGDEGNRPRFVPITTLEDVQAVRCAEFHPSGQLYAVGSNSKTLRICAYPKIGEISESHEAYQPTVLFKITKHHKGSIYCLAWSPVGDLMATGSNDKTVKLMRFNGDTSKLEGDEIELSMHDGTVRDLCFLEDTSNKSSLLISGGAGDCKIYVTDCATGTPFQALSGHSGHILSLYTWGGAMFVSGSHDKTVRFWDLRTRGCVNMVTPCTVPGTRQGSAVSSVCVDPSGRLLVSGHEDSSCVLYDIRGGRNIQCFKPHTADVRSIRFSPSAYYLLTAGYDNKLVLTDLQGDLTLPLPSVVVAQHQDKVISSRWHPTEFSFLSTSADKTSTLWALPPI